MRLGPSSCLTRDAKSKGMQFADFSQSSYGSSHRLWMWNSNNLYWRCYLDNFINKCFGIVYPSKSSDRTSVNIIASTLHVSFCSNSLFCLPISGTWKSLLFLFSVYHRLFTIAMLYYMFKFYSSKKREKLMTPWHALWASLLPTLLSGRCSDTVMMGGNTKT